MSRRQPSGGRLTGGGTRPSSARSRIARALVLAGICVLVGRVRPAAADTFFFRDRAGVTHFTNVPTDKRYKALESTRSRFSQVLFTPGGSTFRTTPIAYSSVPFGSATMRWRGDRMIEPPADLAEMLNQTAARYGVEPELVHAVVRAESAFDERAVSSAGAMGLMQLMPGTAQLVGVRNAFHPQQNVEGGVYYLRMMLDRFDNNVALALAAYNAGPGAVEAYGGVPPYPETQEYLDRVFRYRQEYLRKSIERSQLAYASRRR